MLYNIQYYARIYMPIFAITIGSLLFTFGILYIVYSFNKNECDRVHDLGYETDFDFYGGCYVKVNGHWIPFEIQGVNVVTEGK